MTLSRRISLLTIFVIAITSLTIALLTAFSARSAALNQVDDRLLEVRSTASASDDPVDAILTDIRLIESGTVAYLAVDEDSPISLLETDVTPTNRQLPPLTERRLSELQQMPDTVEGPLPIRLTAIPLGDQQWLVIGEPIDDIVAQFQTQLLTNSILAVVVSILGGSLVAAGARRTLSPLRRMVGYASAVASGRLDSVLEPDSPTREVRELQTSIAEMVESLKHAAESKSQSEADMRVFLADVAHELRTPLTTVRAYADVLAAEGPIDSEVRTRAQQRIAQESRRMSRLIDDLLLLARLTSTQLGTTTLVDVASLVGTHFADLQVLDPQRRVEISTESCLVDGDQALLERMFANLTSNVHRHTPNNASVIVTCTSGDAVRFTVDDAGPGLDDDQLRQLAQGVERFGSRRSGDRHGTGLGLHLVSSIARSHGGVATFSRSPLGGLRITITLPIALSGR
ncbi:MAG: ATP-binding protein [Actinomycetota bacterium]